MRDQPQRSQLRYPRIVRPLASQGSRFDIPNRSPAETELDERRVAAGLPGAGPGTGVGVTTPTTETEMAELTPLDEKLGEVLGLAQAAQDATAQVAEMEGADEFGDELARMKEEAAETERRTDDLIDGLEGRKTAIREKARETKGEASEMREAYLADEEEALDGFEFLTMAEAGELGHWEIVQKMGQTLGEEQVTELADWAVGVQQRHFERVRESSLKLAEAEVRR
jgi:hypothetical protein